MRSFMEFQKLDEDSFKDLINMYKKGFQNPEGDTVLQC